MQKYLYNKDLKIISEAYRSVYDNPNVHLDGDECKKRIAKIIDETSKEHPEILKYIDMIFRWYKNTPEQSKTLFVSNLWNDIDVILEFDEMVSTMGKDADSFTDTFNGKDRTVKDAVMFRNHNAFRMFVYNMRKFFDKFKETESLKNFTDEDKRNIEVTSIGNGAIVFATRTFESTNRFIYFLWKNTNMSTDYGNPSENSPYCTRMEMHWRHYSHDDPNYKQYWFLRNDGEPCEYGNLENPSVMKKLMSFEGQGASRLICMNDTYGDILDRYDEKPIFQDVHSIKEFEDINNSIAEVSKRLQGMQSECLTYLNIFKDYKKKVTNFIKSLYDSHDYERLFKLFEGIKIPEEIANNSSLKTDKNDYTDKSLEDYILNTLLSYMDIFKIGKIRSDASNSVIPNFENVKKMMYNIQNMNPSNSDFNFSDITMILKFFFRLDDEYNELYKTFQNLCNERNIAEYENRDTIAKQLQDSISILNVFKFRN